MLSQIFDELCVFPASRQDLDMVVVSLSRRRFRSEKFWIRTGASVDDGAYPVLSSAGRWVCEQYLYIDLDCLRGI
jgi:hypothetical protein